MSRFLGSEFGGNRVNIHGVSTDKATRKCVNNFRGIRNFVFDAYYIDVCIKFDDFFPRARKRKILSIHRLERAQYAFMDHSKPSFS